MPDPFEKDLPAAVADELCEIACSDLDITEEFVRGLEKRLDLHRCHQITPRRLGNYLRRLRKRAAGEKPMPCPAERIPPDAKGDEKLRTHRMRQAWVASILEATFGSFAECNPDLWDRHAYLMLVGSVYDRLANSEAEIATDELAALAKVLAECRRVAVPREPTPRKAKVRDEAVSPRGRLPERFAGVVRQVYGANFQGPNEIETDKPGADRSPSKEGS